MKTFLSIILTVIMLSITSFVSANDYADKVTNELYNTNFSNEQYELSRIDNMVATNELYNTSVKRSYVEDMLLNKIMVKMNVRGTETVSQEIIPTLINDKVATKTFYKAEQVNINKYFTKYNNFQVTYTKEIQCIYTNSCSQNMFRNLIVDMKELKIMENNILDAFYTLPNTPNNPNVWVKEKVDFDYAEFVGLVKWETYVKNNPSYSKQNSKIAKLIVSKLIVKVEKKWENVLSYMNNMKKVLTILSKKSWLKESTRNIIKALIDEFQNRIEG